ncbi:MAG: hypothetical protein ACRBN8_41640 [Nannocystales bacterium]
MNRDKNGGCAVFSAFEAGDVDVETFNHRAHVRVAWHALEALPLLEALPRFCAGLRALVRAHGAEAKFNATMSVAFLLLVSERRRRGESWAVFEEREHDFIAAGLEPVLAVYDREQLEAPCARASFELPALDAVGG